MQLERYSDAAAPFQYHLKRQTILKGPSYPLTQVAMRLPTKQRLYARNLEKAEKLFRDLVQMVNVSRDVHKGFREECIRELCDPITERDSERLRKVEELLRQFKVLDGNRVERLGRQMGDWMARVNMPSMVVGLLVSVCAFTIGMGCFVG
jgi:hypothetical protein